jgi:hypothetical protein
MQTSLKFIFLVLIILISKTESRSSIEEEISNTLKDSFSGLDEPTFTIDKRSITSLDDLDDYSGEENKNDTCNYSVKMEITEIQIIPPSKTNKNLQVALKVKFEEEITKGKEKFLRGKKIEKVLDSKEHFNQILMETQNFEINKNISNGQYVYRLNKDNMYWLSKEEMGKNEFKSFEINDLISKITQNKYKSHYKRDLDFTYMNNSMANDSINEKKEENEHIAKLNLKDIPCDSELPIIVLNEYNIVMRKTNETHRSFFCMEVRSTGHSVNLTFDLKLNFFKKKHLRLSASQFLNKLKSMKEVLSKFASAENLLDY